MLSLILGMLDGGGCEKIERKMATRTPLTILLVEADSNERYLLGQALQQEGYATAEADSARHLLRVVRQVRPAAIVLDADLPDMNAFEACMQLRALPVVSHTPVLFLGTAHNADYIARALDSGGDDFLRRPFALSELRARVRALLRRTAKRALSAEPTIVLDSQNFCAVIDGRRVILTPTEYHLLEHLCTHKDEHHTANSLLEMVWAYPPGGGDTALVRNHIRNLRRKIEHNPDQPRILISAHGRGYTINAQIALIGPGYPSSASR